MPTRPRTIALALLVLTLLPASARPDSAVATRAMNATTIAEIFIDPGTLRIELEIGSQDLAGFADLLPNALYQAMGFSPHPFDQRLQRFFRDGLTIKADGRLLTGGAPELEVRQRIHRDVITGAPLPLRVDDAEQVFVVVLRYHIPGDPRVIELAPPRTEGRGPAPEIGFMAYHRGIPVNDFRYLRQLELLRLDWEDPWYSRFDNRDLWREHDSPVSAFVYVEPHEVRQEVVIRPRDLQHWVDLGLEGKEVIPAAEQQALTAKVVEFLSSKNPLTINNESVEGRLDRAHFIYRDLRSSGVIDPPRDLDLYSATLGIIFYYPYTSLPREITLEWELFNERIRHVPASATDDAGTLEQRITPDEPMLVWTNNLGGASRREFVVVTAPPGITRIGYGAMALLSVLVAIVIWLRHRATGARYRPRLALAWIFVALLVSSMSLRAALNPSYLAPARADAVLSALLENLYRAFDMREESRIYDALSRSASGELLTDIFLQTRRSLELENQGGARAKVQAVELVEATHDGLPGKMGFISHGTWNVSGSVGHWGHTHVRRNQYQARFVVTPVDGVWKITELELLQEKRL